MPGFDGTGPNGMGPMTGGGRGFCNPRGTGYAVPRRNTYTYPRYRSYGYGYGYRPYVPYVPRVTTEQELEYLKGQAEALRDELKGLEAEIEAISAKKSEE